MSSPDPRRAMVDNQIRPADVTSYAVLAAFLDTKREAFVPNEWQSQAYSEFEIPLGKGREMLRPRSLAKLIEAAAIRPHHELLLIGGNTGYAAAILSQLAESVMVLESNKTHAAKAEENLAAQGYNNAVIMTGKFAHGLVASAPYDRIIINGAVNKVPKALIDQLKPAGRLVTYRTDGVVTTALALTKHENGHSEEALFDCAAPVLIAEPNQRQFVF